MESNDDDGLQQFLKSGNVSDVIMDAGWTSPLSDIRKCDIPHLVEVISFNAVILKAKAEFDEFTRGLDIAMVLPHIRSNSELFKPLFVATKEVSLTAGRITFHISHS